MKKPTVIKSYYKHYIESSSQRVIALFVHFPDKEFSLSEVAKLTKVKKSNIGKILDVLYREELIIIIKLKNIWRIKANRDNLKFTRIKIVYNLNFIYRSGLVEFLVNTYKNPRAVILFGSFRKGEDNSDSDIDIAILDSSVKEYQTFNIRELYEFEKEINRKIQIHLFNERLVDINVFNSIANGMVLWGFLEVRPNVI